MLYKKEKFIFSSHTGIIILTLPNQVTHVIVIQFQSDLIYHCMCNIDDSYLPVISLNFSTDYSFERETGGLRRIAGYGVTVTRGAASAMMFTYCALLITMSRNMITFFRETFLHRFIPWDSMHALHKFIAYQALFSTGKFNAVLWESNYV